MNKINLSLILPVHNQETIIEPVLKQIIKTLENLNIKYEILLIENGSKDNTFKKIYSLEKKYRRIKAYKTTQGYGNAVIYGINQSKGKYVSYMPSDGQVEMKLFPILWDITEHDIFNIVKVKRNSRETKNRYILSKLFSVWITLFFNTPIIDINGSPRILKSKQIKSLKLISKDSFIDAEMLIKASKLNWKIIEIPMGNLDRYGGDSSRNYKTYLEFIKNIFYYKFHSFS